MLPFEIGTKQKRQISQVDGINDTGIIAEHFASHFERVYTNGSELGSARLRSEYLSKRSQYQGQPYIKDYAALAYSCCSWYHLPSSRCK